VLDKMKVVKSINRKTGKEKEYVIEDHVPLPGKGKWGFLWEMTKGQSVVIEKEDARSLKTYAYVHGLKIQSQALTDNKVRIWMIDPNGTWRLRRPKKTK
tara:strand:- start:499 stop:795 length:297 start_codon:yes stop_codon:yes gene_type:complete